MDHLPFSMCILHKGALNMLQCTRQSRRFLCAKSLDEGRAKADSPLLCPLDKVFLPSASCSVLLLTSSKLASLPGVGVLTLLILGSKHSVGG